MPLRRLVNRVRRVAATSALHPSQWRPSWEAARALWTAYGHARTVRSRSAVDRHGQPIPWYTYPAIEYLSQFDFTDKQVFEWGSGNSTLFWAARSKDIVSVEDDEQWFAVTNQRRSDNCTLLLEPDLHRYVNRIDDFPGGFDIIVVDGPARGRTRRKCAAAALRHLRPGGFIVLDNSDWLPESARLLRESGLLQVDMSGFFPIGGHTQTTSIFFDRACELRPLHGRQPHLSLAGVPKNWEPPVVPEGDAVHWEGEPIFGIIERVSFSKAAPGGERSFQMAVRRRAGYRDAVYLYDESAQRVLLGPEPLTESIEMTLRRLDTMTWDEFCAYVRNSPMRRYILDDRLS